MAYRANLYDFGAIGGLAGGANALANNTALQMALASPTKIIEIEPDVFEISQQFVHNASGKSFVGTDGNDCFGTESFGTRFHWTGAAGIVMAVMRPAAPGKDLIAPAIHNVQFNGGGLASGGLHIYSARVPKAYNVQATGLQPLGSSIAFYMSSIGTTGAGDVNCAYRGDFLNMFANVSGGAHGIMIDGTNTFGNTCFGSFRNSHVTHENGIGYYLRGCDDNHFYNAATSRGAGATGTSVLFDGSGTQQCVGNAFIGLQCGANPAGTNTTIISRGIKARRNIIMPLSGVDAKPNIILQDNSQLWTMFTGGGYSGTDAGEQALFHMMKRDEVTW